MGAPPRRWFQRAAFATAAALAVHDKRRLTSAFWRSSSSAGARPRRPQLREEGGQLGAAQHRQAEPTAARGGGRHRRGHPRGGRGPRRAGRRPQRPRGAHAAAGSPGMRCASCAARRRSSGCGPGDEPPFGGSGTARVDGSRGGGEPDVVRHRSARSAGVSRHRGSWGGRMPVTATNGSFDAIRRRHPRLCGPSPGCARTRCSAASWASWASPPSSFSTCPCRATS